MAKSRKHFLLVAFPAFGHLIPLLELGKKIAKHHNVTFAVSACLVEKILKRELMVESDFHLVAIEDGYIDWEIDVQVENGPKDLEANLIRAYTGAHMFFKEVPAADKPTPSHGITSPIDTIIADNMLAYPLTVCRERGIPYHLFNSASISMTLGALMIDDDTPTLPETNENNLVFNEIGEPGSAPPPVPPVMKALLLPIHKTMHLANGIVVNSVREIDGDFLKIIESFPIMKNIPIRFVGPLVPEVEKTSHKNLEQQNRVEKWLDDKAPCSVVYVSFGSLAFPKPEQLKEFIAALTQLDKPFILSLAAAQQKHVPSEVSANIATQFEHGQSLILPWAPQKTILQHPATAVFLSHCGWNSTMESVFCGMPVVAWPMFADQKLNAQVMVKIGIAAMVEGTGMAADRIIPADEIVTAISNVGWLGDGSIETSYRQAAQKWRRNVLGVNGSGGASERELQDLMTSV